MVRKEERFIAHFPNKAAQICFFTSKAERERSLKQIKPPHIRPNAVLIVAIGCTWEPGAWQKVMDMVEYTNQKKVCCWLTEVVDPKIYLPYMIADRMRDAGCRAAHDNGFEWVMLIENDALPEKDLILRLLECNMPVVVPYIRDGKKVLAEPEYEPNSGLRIVRWAVLTCILMWVRVLNCFPNCKPFQDMSAEPDFYESLMHYGHRVYQDTNTELRVANPPTYPGDCKNLGEMIAFWNEADQRRRREPDRKPIDPEDRRELYLP